MKTETSNDLAADEAIDPEKLDAEDDVELTEDAQVDTDADADADDDSDGDGEEEEETAALDELEAEELEMLTDDETTETLVVDEAAEMRAIRRAEIALEGEGADEATPEEFVCSSCFLVKRTSQLASKRKKICADCAS